MRALDKDPCFINFYRKGLVEPFFEDPSRIAYLTFSFEARRELRRNGLQYTYVDDLFPIGLHSSVDEVANGMTETWYGPFGEALEYEGINIGSLFTHFLCYYFKDVLKSHHIVAAALDGPDPRTVYCSPPLRFGSWSTAITMPMYAHLPLVVRGHCERRGHRFVELGIGMNDQRYDRPMQQGTLHSLAFRSLNLWRDVVRGVMHRINRRARRVLSIMPRKDILEILRSMEDRYGLTFMDYIPAKDVLGRRSARGRRFVGAAMKAWDELRADGRFLSELPKSYDDVWPALEADFRQTLGSLALDICDEIDRITRVLDSFDVEFLLVQEDFTPLARARVAVAERLGIPSGVILHGFLPKVWHSPYRPPTGKYNLVWGPGYADRFATEGFPRERVIETGITYVDVILDKPTTEDIRRVRESLYIPEGRRLLLWATQPAHLNFSSKSMRVYEEDIRDIFKVMKERDELLVVKTHWIDPVENYREIAQEMGFSPVITREHLPVLLTICDALLADSSTVGLQGLIVRKPFILLGTQHMRDISGYAEHGVAELVTRIDQLPDALDRALHGGDAARPSPMVVDRFLDTFATHRDGSSMGILAQTIADRIEVDRSMG